MKKPLYALAALFFLVGCGGPDFTSSAEANGYKEPLHLNINPQRLFIIQSYSDAVHMDRDEWFSSAQEEFRKCGFQTAFGVIHHAGDDQPTLGDPMAPVMAQIQTFQPDYILSLTEKDFLVAQKGIYDYIAGTDNVKGITYDIRLSSIAQNQVVWKAEGIGNIKKTIKRMKRDGIFAACPQD
jgi:hypothetical protein